MDRCVQGRSLHVPYGPSGRITRYRLVQKHPSRRCRFRRPRSSRERQSDALKDPGGVPLTAAAPGAACPLARHRQETRTVLAPSAPSPPPPWAQTQAHLKAGRRCWGRGRKPHPCLLPPATAPLSISSLSLCPCQHNPLRASPIHSAGRDGGRLPLPAVQEPAYSSGSRRAW